MRVHRDSVCLGGRLTRGLACLTMAFVLSALPMPAQSSSDLKPTPQHTVWQDLEFGVILHFSTNTFLDREGATELQIRSYLTRRSSIPTSGWTLLRP